MYTHILLVTLPLAKKIPICECNFMFLLTTFRRSSMFIYSLYSTNYNYVRLIIFYILSVTAQELKHNTYNLQKYKPHILMMIVSGQKCIESLFQYNEYQFHIICMQNIYANSIVTPLSITPNTLYNFGYHLS